MIEITYLIPLTIGLTELIKRVFTKLESRWIPLIALGVGMGLSFYFNIDKSFGEITQQGIIATLSAIGLWSGTKSSIGK